MKEIMNRRSVRKYTDKTIPQEQIEKLLKAAMRAPSAGNEQPWEFIVIKSRQTMLKVMDFHPYATMLKQADCLIFVCGDINKQKFPYDFWIQDCSAATQNILIEANSMGIGGVWLGVYPIAERTKGIAELLNLPEHVIPLCGVSLGYPAEESQPMDTYDPERIHKEVW